jgi:pantothenate kinase
MSRARTVSAETLSRVVAERARGRNRFVVAIAGPPGSGKSTLASRLAHDLNARSAGTAMVIPMDGFHYDNAVLNQRNLLARKGAPETFDFGGFLALLDRLSKAAEEVAIPIFDRELDLARAGAGLVIAENRILIAEGNYLLMDEPPWSTLAGRFDLTCRLEVDLAELERRLVQRWLDHGYEPGEARARAVSNDLPNAHRVLANALEPDFIIAAG